MIAKSLNLTEQIEHKHKMWIKHNEMNLVANHLSQIVHLTKKKKLKKKIQMTKWIKSLNRNKSKTIHEMYLQKEFLNPRKISKENPKKQ